MPDADPLSDVLSLLSAKSLLSASLRASGDWSVRFPSEGVKFNAVLEGTCVISIEGSNEPISLEAGDCFLLTNCGSYILCSDPAMKPTEAHDIFSHDTDVRLGDDVPGFHVIGGRITFDETDAALLLQQLPPLVHVNGGLPESEGIRWLLSRLSREWSLGLPGGALAFDHLAQLLFVEVIRVWLRSMPASADGWLQALNDRRIGIAVQLLHRDPTRAWQLEELANAAGMSRSNFALQFKKLVGVSPFDYLVRWRMRLAAKTLRNGADSISTLAFSLGYRSESAFSNAFKRVTGVAPHHYRLKHQRKI